MSRKITGRSRRDEEQAKFIGSRIVSRLNELGMSRRAFAKAVGGITGAAITQLVKGSRNAASSPYLGRIAKALLWSKDELLYPETGHAISNLTAIEVEHWLTVELSNIIGEPLTDLGDTGWLRRVDCHSLQRAVRVCADTIPRIRCLTSGVQLMRARYMLEVIIEIATAAYRFDIIAAKQLQFDAADQDAHCASFVLPGSMLGSATYRDLLLMADTVIRCKDPVLWLRYNVRCADILKICGRSAEAFKILKEVFQVAESKKLAASLSYPAYRTGCMLAAEGYHALEFSRFVSRAQRGIDGGYLRAHDIATVLEGLSDSFAFAFERTNNTRYRNWALATYEEGKAYLATIEKHGGGTHIEFSLRLGMRPLTFYKAGITDLVSSHGMSLAAKAEEMARKQLTIAIEAGSDRTAQRLQQTIRELTADGCKRPS